jgi:DNA mismatch repair protein MSH6
LAWWTKPEFIRDAKMRRPDDPNYDKTSIHIPDSAWTSLSSSMIQYWRLKQFHYDKIFFFRLGKFYEIFYDDAVLCNKILDLHWMS